jgi:ATP-dependent DNA ligase
MGGRFLWRRWTAPTVFAHACKMGLEGIASKRKDSPYRSGRSPDWLKMEEPERTGP